MDALAEVLRDVGVLDWLRSQFPHLSDGELVAAVDGDFDAVIMALESERPLPCAEGKGQKK